MQTIKLFSIGDALYTIRDGHIINLVVDEYHNPECDTDTIDCPNCDGLGYAPEDDEDGAWNICCPHCDGNGFIAA